MDGYWLQLSRSTAKDFEKTRIRAFCLSLTRHLLAHVDTYKAARHGQQSFCNRLLLVLSASCSRVVFPDPVICNGLSGNDALHKIWHCVFRLLFHFAPSVLCKIEHHQYVQVDIRLHSEQSSSVIPWFKAVLLSCPTLAGIGRTSLFGDFPHCLNFCTLALPMPKYMLLLFFSFPAIRCYLFYWISSDVLLALSGCLSVYWVWY